MLLFLGQRVVSSQVCGWTRLLPVQYVGSGVSPQKRGLLLGLVDQATALQLYWLAAAVAVGLRLIVTLLLKASRSLLQRDPFLDRGLEQLLRFSTAVVQSSGCGCGRRLVVWIQQ